MVKLLKSWWHSGFHVFCGNRIQPGDKDAMESLPRYIIQACFSQERMTYIPEESKVVYVFKNGKEKKEFEALEWLAAICSHIPDKSMQMVHSALNMQERIWRQIRYESTTNRWFENLDAIWTIRKGDRSIMKY